MVYETAAVSIEKQFVTQGLTAKKYRKKIEFVNLLIIL